MSRLKAKDITIFFKSKVSFIKSDPIQQVLELENGVTRIILKNKRILSFKIDDTDENSPAQMMLNVTNLLKLFDFFPFDLLHLKYAFCVGRYSYPTLSNIINIYANNDFKTFRNFGNLYLVYDEYRISIETAGETLIIRKDNITTFPDCLK